MSTLEHKVAVVTGAARGLGRALTTAFIEAGCRVVAIDRSWDPSGFSGDRDDEFRQALAEESSRVLVASVDITDADAIAACYSEAVDKFGTIDVLVNNAAMRQRDLFPPTGRVNTLETTNADWQRMFEVNVFGTLSVTRQFIKPMLDQGSGSVMSLVSRGATHNSAGGAYEAPRPNSQEMPYQSTKAALMAMMFYLADETRAQNVAVNVLMPGHTRTTGYDEQNAARRQVGIPTSVTGPVSVKPDHIVPIAMLLAANDARSGMTGKAFDVRTWNTEHGLGPPSAWADLEADAGVEAALRRA